MSGLQTSATVNISPGETKRFSFPYKHLLVFNSQAAPSLDALLARNASITVSFEVTEDELSGNQMAGLPPPYTVRYWIGQLTSPKINPN
jgi:hypothetical protein